MGDVFTSAGEGFVVDELDAFGTYYIHWGTGTTAAVKGDSALETASAESRVSTTDTQPAADTFQWVGELTSASDQTISEMGVFDASTSGTCIIRSTFSGVSLALGDKIEFTVQLQFS